MTSEEVVREEEARAFGNNSKLVEKRLRDSATMLLTKYRKGLDTPHAVFDAQTRMLISVDQTYALVWLLRAKPDQPVGYLNQQLSHGVVSLIEIGAFSVNPNV